MTKQLQRAVLLLLFLAGHVSAQTEADYLAAWLDQQRASDLVESIEKKTGDIYHIKFSTLPYEGELKILSVNIEAVPPYNSDEDDISHIGTMDVDLVDASQEFFQRYQSVYYRWQGNHNLYFDQSTNQWINAEDYQRRMMENAYGEASGTDWMLVIVEYWCYVLIGIILFFFFSQLVNNKKVDKSLSMQQKSVDLQAEAIEKAMALHRETNDHLKAILEEMKNTKSR